MSEERRKSLIAHRDRSLGELNYAQQELGEPLVMLTGWNKVEDNLPDDEIEVLVYCAEEQAFYMAWHDSELDCFLATNECRVNATHWMEIIPPATTN